MISPGTDDARNKALLHQVRDPLVGSVEVLGPDPRVILLPTETGFVHSARVEGRHVGIQASHNLDHAETLGLAVRGQLLKIVRPMKSLAEPHPPGVTQPEKRRLVHVFEMPSVGCDLNGSVKQQRVVAGVRLDGHLAGLVVQRGVFGLGTVSSPPVRAGQRRGIADLPHLSPGPERRDSQCLLRRCLEYDVQLHVVKRIAIVVRRRKSNLHHPIRLRACDDRLARPHAEWQGRQGHAHSQCSRHRQSAARSISRESSPYDRVHLRSPC